MAYGLSNSHVTDDVIGHVTPEGAVRLSWRQLGFLLPVLLLGKYLFVYGT